MIGRCVVSQPTFLPWVGYFDLVDQASVFVFLDQVQFSKQSWQQRNRIVTADGLAWITVPVRIGGRGPQPIHDVEIDGSKAFPRKLLRTLDQHYRKAPYFAEFFPPIADIVETTWDDGLSRMNIALIQHLLDVLGIDTETAIASELEVSGQRSELLVEICATVGCSRYLSAAGSLDYLVEDAAIFDAAGVSVEIHQYAHPEYPQQHTPFAPFASTADLLFNTGRDALHIIRSGRRTATLLEAS